MKPKPRIRFDLSSRVVGERSLRVEAISVRSGGAKRSENVGISSKKTGENPVHRKPKVSWATIFVPGLVGPKVNPKGVADGHEVNIPQLLSFFEGGTLGR